MDMENFNKKVCFTGAQGTGKTTILRKMQELGYPIITEVVRKLKAEQGISINKDGDNHSQNLVFKTYMDLFNTKPAFISDRGLTDVISYTKDGVEHGMVDGVVLFEQEELIRKFTADHPDMIYIYFPIEFPVVADGVRSEDEEYRSSIDHHIHSRLEELGVDYLTVSGTPEERLEQILHYISAEI